MNAEQIAKLKELAQAAAHHGDSIGEDDWYSAEENMSIFAPSPDLSYIAAATPQAVLDFIEHYERTNTAAKLYGETLQRIGNTIGLLAGDDLTVKALPRIEKLVEAEKATPPVSALTDERIMQIAAPYLHIDITALSDETEEWVLDCRNKFIETVRAILAAAAPSPAIQQESIDGPNFRIALSAVSWESRSAPSDAFEAAMARLIARIDAHTAAAVAKAREEMVQLFTDPENQPTQYGTVLAEAALAQPVDLSNLTRYAEYYSPRGSCVASTEDGPYVLFADVEQLLSSLREGGNC